MELTPAQFADFFQALWGYPPFAWQQALAARMLQSTATWPETMGLPTASGKTACIDIAVFALASQAYAGDARTAPRRLIFVVDRRIIVDDAFQRAKRLADKLRAACDQPEGILAEVAKRLCHLSGTGVPLEVHQLRGGVHRSDSWARSPSQPMVISSTVDQVGSRLLFRGYGVSQKSWPIQAGLLGTDSLVLLDEAHCAQPFLATLRTLAQLSSKDWVQTQLAPTLLVAALSATPGAIASPDVFRDDSTEPTDPNHPLGRRLTARKLARLVKVPSSKTAASQEMAAVLVAEALALVNLSEVDAPAVVIFANRVDTARHAAKLLSKAGADVTLLTGRARPLDKDATVGALSALSTAAASGRQLGRPRFVVATQTLEVGADLDFDLLVTECASIDALLQRFGRLNRSGRAFLALAVVVYQAGNAKNDPVYGAAAGATWNWLSDFVVPGTFPSGKKKLDKGVDFGVNAMTANLREHGTAELYPPAKEAVLLLPAHMDLLAQTGPAPAASPDVAVFLRGPTPRQQDVQVCWRADLVGDAEQWPATVTVCPPTAPECVSIPIFHLRGWLAGRQHGVAGSDVEGEAVLDDDKWVQEISPVVVWRGRDAVQVITRHRDIRPGDVVVLPASQGGMDVLTAGQVGAYDLGDQALARTRDRAQLRAHPDVLGQWPSCASLVVAAQAIAVKLQQDWDGDVSDLRSALRECAAHPDTPGWLQDLAKHLAATANLRKLLVPHPHSGLVLSSAARLHQEDYLGVFSDEDDVSSSGLYRHTLDSHSHGVAETAARMATLCGLPPALVEILGASGLGHDFGKAEPRFQSWLYGGSAPWFGPVLAKSAMLPASLHESRAARVKAGYPEGGRHELLSVRLLESGPLPGNPLHRDLLLHLVESSHGHCRPFAPVVHDAAPVTVTLTMDGVSYTASSATGLERLDAGPADRYWNLTAHYGWWGLAYLEAILRLADHRRSEWESRQENSK